MNPLPEEYSVACSLPPPFLPPATTNEGIEQKMPSPLNVGMVGFGNIGAEIPSPFHFAFDSF